MQINNKKGTHKKSSSRKRVSRNPISESDIFALFLHNKEGHYTPKSIMRKQKLTSARDRGRIIEILKQLKKNGKIIKTDAGGYVVNSKLEILNTRMSISVSIFWFNILSCDHY